MKRNGNRFLRVVALVAASVAVQSAYAVQDVAGAVEVTVKKIDLTGKTVIGTAADGTEHVYHLADDVTVHTGKGVRSSIKEIPVGSKAAVHYSVEGGHETVHEVDALGKSGLKSVEASALHVDHAGKTISFKVADGSTRSYDLADHAAKESAKGIGAGTKATVYYADEGGKQVVHFIGKAI